MALEVNSMASKSFSEHILNKISTSPTKSTNNLHANTSNVGECSTGSPEVETDEDEVVCQQKKYHSPLGLIKFCKTSVMNTTGNMDIFDFLKLGKDYFKLDCSNIYDGWINVVKWMSLRANSDCEFRHELGYNEDGTAIMALNLNTNIDH